MFGFDAKCHKNVHCNDDIFYFTHRYTGFLCDKELCGAQACENGGVCDKANTVCTCRGGYYGTYCESFLRRPTTI